MRSHAYTTVGSELRRQASGNGYRCADEIRGVGRGVHVGKVVNENFRVGAHASFKVLCSSISSSLSSICIYSL